jgi:hypothetical protein
MDIVGTAQRLIRRGYGFNQLLAELNITKDKFYEICNKDLSFKHEVERRYDVTIDSIIEKDRNNAISKREKENRGESQRSSKPRNNRNKGNDTHSIK